MSAPTAVLHVELAGPGAAALMDTAVDVLWQHGAVGVHEQDGPDGVVLVSAFEPTTDPEDVAHAVAARVPSARVAVVADDGSWWDAWRAHARPVVAGEGRVVVVPAWWSGPGPTPAPGGVTVRVDPGRTFGSGAHATTRLVLDELARLDLDGARVLDVGGGSGVLAVTAAMLGAAEALAVDIDPGCEGVVRANAAANGVADRVTARTGDLGAVVGDRSFDVVLANVLLPVLEDLASVVVRSARRWLVVSGLLAGTSARAVAALPAWRVVRHAEFDDWVALLLSPSPLLAEANEHLP